LHTLYENADPFELKEPSGTLRTNDARYEAISDHAVRVSRSEFVRDAEYTIKLEGVRKVGYSTILMGGVVGDVDVTGIAIAAGRDVNVNIPPQKPNRRRRSLRSLLDVGMALESFGPIEALWPQAATSSASCLSNGRHS
jgi:hypothetical protein